MGVHTGANGSIMAMKKRSDSSLKTVVIYVTILSLCALSLLHFGLFARRFNSPPSSVASTTIALSLASDQGQTQSQKLMIEWDSQPYAYGPHASSEISCDRSQHYYDLCSINGPTVLDPNTSTFYAIGPIHPNHFVEKIRPYPRKWENYTMSKIKELTLVSGSPGPKSCDIVHNAHAIVFSGGGYTGNFFHEFNEELLPLFITVRSLSILDQDVILVISEARHWWLSKYDELFRAISKHPIVNLGNDTSTHCFSSATIGLISHGFVTINPKLIPHPINLAHFHYFLDGAYAKVGHTIPQTRSSSSRPKLLFVTRPSGVGRALLNQAQVEKLAKEIGFDVEIFDPKPEIQLKDSYRLVNESHVMVGVHGAALTHLFFLRPGSVFIQIIPIGTDPIAEQCYGNPAKEMGLDYMEYKVRIQESSLALKYSKLDPILNDPGAIRKKGWSLLKRVYLKEQDVQLDLSRFSVFLKKAYRKARRFMRSVG